MSTGNSPEIFKTSLEEEFKGCNGIQQVTNCKHPEKPVVGKVLIKEYEIIPEIQVGFSPGYLR